jgi:very-short-patch-repair endonuclease
MTVDALWRTERLVVEVDGEGHRSPAQIERDRWRELRVRAAGLTAIRYSGAHIDDEPEAVIADLKPQLTRAAQLAGSGSR